MPLKILLADDNITAQRTGAKILTDAGHTVVAVSNGAAAVKKIASEKPELLILDVYMPGYTGLEVCEKVKGAPDTAGVPVLLTITPMEPFNLEDGNRVKADGVLTKPFEAIAVDLVAVVAKFEQKLHPAVAAEPLATQKVEAPQEFEDASYAEWKEAAGDEEPAKPVAMSAEVAAAPALGIDDLAPEPAAAAAPFAMDIPAVEPPPEPSPAPSPAVFGLEAPPAAAAEFDLSAPAASAAEAPAPAFDLTEPAAPAPAAPPAVAEGVEFTSAPQVGEIAVTAAPELEVTAQAAAGEVVIQQDAGLVTNAEDMSQFATKFGVAHPEEIPVGVAMDIPPAEPVVEEAAPAAVKPPAAEPAPVEPEPAAYEPTQRMEAVAEPAPYEATQRLEAAPEPTPVAEAEHPVESEMRGAFATSGGGAAAAPALEPAPAETASEAAAVPEAADLTQKLVAQFAEELERAQSEAAPAAEPAPEPEPQPAPAAVSQEQRIAEAVTRVLDQHKSELIAAIVRELKG